MKKLLIPLTLAAGLFGSLVWLPDACGQSSPAPDRTAKPGTATRIAYIDLGLILMHYKKREDLLQDVKGQAEASYAKIQQMITEGQELEKSLRDGTLERESPEFVELEKKVIKLSSSVNTFKTVKEQEFKRGEAKALVAIYKNVSDAVQQFAEQNGYTLVLRIDRESAKSYTAISQTMNQPIVRHAARDDITDAVVAWLNKQYTAAGGAAGLSTSSGPHASENTRPTTRTSSSPRDVPAPGSRKGTAR